MFSRIVCPVTAFLEDSILAYQKPGSPQVTEAHSPHPSAACQGSGADSQSCSVIESWHFVLHVDQDTEKRDQVAEPRPLQWSYEWRKVIL